MTLQGKKLGILLSVGPATPGFRHGLRLAETALDAGVEVYLYCLDDAVEGLTNAGLQALRGRGVRLFACAYGAQRRGIPVNDAAVFSGLTVVSDLLAATDRLVSFN